METVVEQMGPESAAPEHLTVDTVRQRLYNVGSKVLDAIDDYLLTPGSHSGWVAGEQALGPSTFNSLTGEGLASLMPDVLQAKIEQYALRDVARAAKTEVSERIMGQIEQQLHDDFDGLLDEARQSDLSQKITQAREGFVASSDTDEPRDTPNDLPEKFKLYYERPEEERQYDPYVWAHDAALFYMRAGAQYLLSPSDQAELHRIQAADEAFAVLAKKRYELEHAALTEQAAEVFCGSEQERQMFDGVQHEAKQHKDDLYAVAEILLLEKRRADFAPTGDGLDLARGIRLGEQLQIAIIGQEVPITFMARPHPETPGEVVFEVLGGQAQGTQYTLGRKTIFGNTETFTQRLIVNDALCVGETAEPVDFGPGNAQVKNVFVDGKPMDYAPTQLVQSEAAVARKESTPVRYRKASAEQQQDLLKRFRSPYGSSTGEPRLFTHDLHSAADVVTLSLGRRSDNYEPEVYRELELQPGKYVNRIDPKSITGEGTILQLEFVVVHDSWQDSSHDRVRDAAIAPGKSLCVWNDFGEPRLDQYAELKIQLGSDKPRWSVANGNRLELLGVGLDDQSTLPSDARRIESTRVSGRRSVGAVLREAGVMYRVSTM